jgi:hypothetical protein
MPIYMKVDGIFSKPGAQPYPGANALVDRVRKAFPRGVGMLVIGESSKEMVRSGKTSGGTNAILIGLLLPAVRKFDSGAHADMALLKGALGPTGQIGVLMGDGSVRPVAGAAGPGIGCDKFDWSYREGGVNDTTF